MATRKDQLHSYQFMMQRVISSVMVRETDPEQTPLRRGVGAVFGGVMLTGLLAIVFGVYGVISNNMGNRWQTEGAIVIERETGAHFIFEEGHLQPVLNFASARLLTDETDPVRVPGRNLLDIPRRVPVGIPGAPDSLPAADRALHDPWTSCSAVGQDPAGSPTTTTVLLIGGQVPGRTPLGEQALLVRDAEDDTRYLVWRSHRHRIAGDDPEKLIRSLYGSRTRETPAGTGWLNGLPAGPDIAPVEVSEQGEESLFPGHYVGDLVFHPVADGLQYYLVLADGLAPLTELQMLLVSGQYSVEPAAITAAAANTAPASDALVPAGEGPALPESPPELALTEPGAETTLCAETVDARSLPQISTGGDLAVAGSALPTMAQSSTGARLADWVLVPPGHVAVVRAVPSETSDTGALNLITDIGLRFPVPSAEILATLGYHEGLAVEMPAALVQRIPAGPTLAPAAARQPVPAEV